MEEKTGHQEAIAQSKEAVQKDVKGLFENGKQFLIELLDFRHDTDHEATVEAIKKASKMAGITGDGWMSTQTHKLIKVG